MDPLISPAEADARIAAALPPPASEHIDLIAAIGRTLSSPIVADRALPPYPRAMMDGYAITHDSIRPDGRLAPAGLHAAGDPPPATLTPGTCWEIMTGACVPSDCIAVVPYEDVDADFVVTSKVAPGQFIHPAGSDAEAGEILVPAGHFIGPAEIAIAASVGLTPLEITRRPRIALITSGDETVPIDTAPEPWQIRRSNGPMIETLLRSRGFDGVESHHIPDEAQAARGIIRRCLECADLIVLCGGISKGKRDLIRPLLEESLGTPSFHGVAQKPGKPLAFWPGPPLIFALPGNPVSVLATFTRYVLPTLTRLEGREPSPRRRALPADVAPLPKLTWLLPLDAAGDPRPPQNSGDFVSIAGTAGFLEIPPARDFTVGQPLRFYSFTDH